MLHVCYFGLLCTKNVYWCMIIASFLKKVKISSDIVNMLKIRLYICSAMYGMYEMYDILYIGNDDILFIVFIYAHYARNRSLSVAVLACCIRLCSAVVDSPVVSEGWFRLCISALSFA